MGFPMAKNLRSKMPASDTLLIHDLNGEATRRFVDEAKASGGAAVEMTDSARELAEKSETIITVLPEPSHVKNLVHRMINSGLPKVTGLADERLFIDCSTIDPASSREVANAVHCVDAGRFIDAPMSGGVVGAEAGTLTFMLGAPDQLLERTRPILSMMGGSIHHCGDQGAGLSAKLANNYLLALCNIATAEAMNLGIKWGLDPKKLGGLINASSGRNWCSNVNNPVPGVVAGSPASRGYKGGFAVGLMKKDLNLAIAAAHEASARLELHERAREVYEAVDLDERCHGKDFSVVYRYLGGAE
ncbi:MAG: hypothetical protein M1832_005337 [Thelocarpon impressellum]|nr:MAG: hypothetical protein M1832_005337 [Thelocarpon impressellum]